MFLPNCGPIPDDADKENERKYVQNLEITKEDARLPKLSLIFSLLKDMYDGRLWLNMERVRDLTKSNHCARFAKEK